MTDSQNEFLARVAFLVLLAGMLVPFLVLGLAFLLPPTPSEVLLCLGLGFGFLSAVVALVLGRLCRQHGKPIRSGVQCGDNRPDWIVYVWHHLFEKTAILDGVFWIIMAVVKVFTA